jgi:uncharacterized protein (TIGR02246 family)
MIRTHLKAILAVFVLVSITAAVSWAKVESNPADEAAIKKLVADFTDCFNRKDAHACTMLYADDGQFTSARGDMQTQGHLDMEKHYQAVLSTFLKNAQRTGTVQSIRFLTPTIASVDTYWELRGATAPYGNDPVPPVRKGLLTWIVTKQNGQWYITIFHEFDFPGKYCPDK